MPTVHVGKPTLTMCYSGGDAIRAEASVSFETTTLTTLWYVALTTDLLMRVVWLCLANCCGRRIRAFDRRSSGIASAFRHSAGVGAAYEDRVRITATYTSVSFRAYMETCN